MQRTHLFAMGARISPMNSVAVAPVAVVGGRAKPMVMLVVVSVQPWKAMPLSV